MPKIIENVREKLLDVAKRQIAERGYANTTIRSVAGECGLAVGTVYNYFSSKDVLIASFMLSDWQECLEQMRHGQTEDARAFLQGVYEMLTRFSERHRALFADADAAKVFATVIAERHRLLRAQLAEVILPICRRASNDEYLSLFIAEAMLTWTMSGVSFEELSALLMKLV